MKILVNEKLSQHKYKTPEGYLICVDSVLARTGNQTYKKNELFTDSDDESEIIVGRSPEEVFSTETLASFENKPITVEHPDEDVNISNYKDYAVGFVRDVKQGTFKGQDVVLGTLVITDEQTIQEIENGEHTELSCGYDCDVIDGENGYQQHHIRGNHVALCTAGRAGVAKIIDANYGGSYDIDPESYFSRDDLIDFEDALERKLGHNAKTRAYVDGKLLSVDYELDGESYGQSAEVTIDMRKIRRPNDLIKNYLEPIRKIIEKEYKEWTNDSKVNDTSLKWNKTYNGEETDEIKLSKGGSIIASYSDIRNRTRIRFLGGSRGQKRDDIIIKGKPATLEELLKNVKDSVEDAVLPEAKGQYKGYEVIAAHVDYKNAPTKVDIFDGKRKVKSYFTSEDDLNKAVREVGTFWPEPPLTKANRDFISNYLKMISGFVRRKDTDIQDILRPLFGKGFKPTVEKINGWIWKKGQYAYKNYFIKLEGYADTFLVTLYADPEQDWDTKEVNAYFTDSVKDNVRKIFYKRRDGKEYILSIDPQKIRQQGSGKIYILEQIGFDFPDAENGLQLLRTNVMGSSDALQNYLHKKGANCRSIDSTNNVNTYEEVTEGLEKDLEHFEDASYSPADIKVGKTFEHRRHGKFTVIGKGSKMNTVIVQYENEPNKKYLASTIDLAEDLNGSIIKFADDDVVNICGDKQMKDDTCTKFTLPKRKNAYGEFKIIAWKNGRPYEDASYYTDDWEDAVATFKDIAKRTGLTVKQNGTGFIADSKMKDNWGDSLYKITVKGDDSTKLLRANSVSDAQNKYSKIYPKHKIISIEETNDFDNIMKVIKK